MYLISLNLKFETKILDIAYLLMLKLMKEPLFTIDKKFILLYIKILAKQGKFREALDFIELKSEFFGDKIERQTIEADLYMQSKNPVLTINVYFNMLRINSHVNHYQESMWETYKTCIRLVLNDFLPKHKNYEYKSNVDYIISQHADTAKGSSHNFEPISIEDKPENILYNVTCSVKNLRKNIVIDTSSRKQVEISNRMKRTSFLAELECKLCIALNCKSYPTYESSALFNLMQDYIELFFEKADVIADLIPYLRLLSNDDAAALREKVKSKIESNEGSNSI